MRLIEYCQGVRVPELDVVGRARRSRRPAMSLSGGYFSGRVLLSLQGLFQLPNQLATKIAESRFIIGDPRQRAAQLHRLDPETGVSAGRRQSPLRGARRQPGRQILRHPVHPHLAHQFAGASESDIKQHQAKQSQTAA